jgi:hypothetical protein
VTTSSQRIALRVVATGAPQVQPCFNGRALRVGATRQEASSWGPCRQLAPRAPFRRRWKSMRVLRSFFKAKSAVVAGAPTLLTRGLASAQMSEKMPSFGDGLGA